MSARKRCCKRVPDTPAMTLCVPQLSEPLRFARNSRLCLPVWRERLAELVERDRGQVVPGDRLIAVAAALFRRRGVAAGMPESHRGGSGRPLVAPLAQREHHREELTAGLGQVVLVARRVLAVLAALDDSR